ncbi:MAG: LacI family DNA-binding transcriptional regulator [Planktomarina sp.]
MSEAYQTPTLEDVAKAAGVSTATVSRCLNTSEKVSLKNRERVMKAVNDLGYTPNFGARVMAAKRTRTIGAIIPTMENAIFARGLQAFQEQLHELGYTLLVASSAYDPELEAEQVKSLIARGADALLLIGYERNAEVYDFLERRNIPALVAWSHQTDNRVPSIGFDNHASMAALTEQVLSYGHKTISVISGIVAGNDRAAGRLQGIHDAMAQAGLSLPDDRVVEATYDFENGGSAFQHLMTKAPRPTAIICGNDILAAGAMHKARDMGLDIPKDVSITGFDDIELASILSPALTTMHVPHRAMGKAAAVEIIDMLEKRSTGRTTKLESSFKLRASLGPVPL